MVTQLASSSPTAARCSNDDGKCALTSAASVEALEYLQSLVALRADGHPQRRRSATCANSSSTVRWRSSSGRRSSSRRCRSRKLDWDLRRRHGARRQDAGRHLWRLEPRHLQVVAAPGRRLEVHPVPDAEDVNGAVVDLIPANVQGGQGLPGQEPQGSGHDPGRSSTTPSRVRSRRATSKSPTSRCTLAQDVYCRQGRRPRPPRRPATRSTRSKQGRSRARLRSARSGSAPAEPDPLASPSATPGMACRHADARPAWLAWMFVAPAGDPRGRA